MLWLKWKLMVTTLPFVVAALGAKLALEFGLGWPGVLEFGEVAIVLTGGIFLTGFMLGGTMADYKESEKLPGELACTLETLEEHLVQATVAGKTLEVGPLRLAMVELTKRVRAWLFHEIGHHDMFEALTGLSTEIQRVEREGGGGYAAKALAEIHNLRKVVTRIGVISRSGFLPSGYALLEALTVLIIGLLLAAKFKTLLAECILVPFVTLIFVYMVRLIRDIDDPFEYAPHGAKNTAEIDLTPIDEYRARLERRAALTGSDRRP
jgi:hypothetical protein